MTNEHTKIHDGAENRTKGLWDHDVCVPALGVVHEQKRNRRNERDGELVPPSNVKQVIYESEERGHQEGEYRREIDGELLSCFSELEGSGRFASRRRTWASGKSTWVSPSDAVLLDSTKNDENGKGMKRMRRRMYIEAQMRPMLSGLAQTQR
jgi:hypothetical protein